jgi:RNA polymerase sigma-70 factor (ECF subfamily)
MAVLALRSEMNRKPADLTDRELLARVLRNEERGWNELIRRYRALIFRCITKVTGKYASSLSTADVDEVYAEVLVSLLRDDMRKLRMYNPNRGTKLGSWIGMISVNAAYDYLRSVGRRPVLDRIDGCPDPHEECDRTPLDMLMEKERWDSFNELLNDFSDKDRTFLDLYYARGMEAEAVAEEMQISLKTVYSKKHKIRAHLRRALDKINGDSAIADLVAVGA